MTYYNESAEDIVKKLNDKTPSPSVSDILSEEAYATVVQKLIKDLAKVANAPSK